MNLDSYVDVASRIAQFYEKFPDGRLERDGEPYVLNMGGTQDALGKPYIVYKALAYRTPEDPVPATGTAWEPWPGPTQFTRDSELMNAETAAIGRAIVMCGIPSQKIASSEEVQARRPEARSGPQVPDTYEECLRLSIRHYDKDELKDDAEWAKLLEAADSPEKQSALVDRLEAALTDLGGSPEKVKARWQEAKA